MLRSMENGNCTVPSGPRMTEDVKKPEKDTRPEFTGGPHNAWHTHTSKATRERAALKIQSKYRTWRASRMLDRALANVKSHIEMERIAAEEARLAAKEAKRKAKE